MVFAKERVKIAERTLATASKISDFVSTRYQQNLYEKSDYLQAGALVASRELELQAARQGYNRHYMLLIAYGVSVNLARMLILPQT